MVRIDPLTQVAHLRFVGEISPDDPIEAFTALARDPGFERGMDMLWDFTDGNLRHFDTTLLRRMTLEMIGTLGAAPRRTALVVGRSVEFGICRMWLALSERYVPEERWRIFWDRAEAEAWLAAPNGLESTGC